MKIELFSFLSVFLFIEIASEPTNLCLPLQSTTGVAQLQTNQTVKQGRPGKIGPAGARGPVGPKRSQGNTGQCACEPSEIEQLRREMRTMGETLSTLGRIAKNNYYSFCGAGVKNGRIPNIAMTSSVIGGDNNDFYARFDNTGEPRRFWHPAKYRSGEWLQVDLGKPTRVIGVVTQGRPNGDQWITSYKILYGNSESGLQVVKSNKKDVIFQGNRDRNSKVKNTFPQPITARYFRLVAVSFRGVPCLRIEYLLC